MSKLLKDAEKSVIGKLIIEEKYKFADKNLIAEVVKDVFNFFKEFVEKEQNNHDNPNRKMS